MTTGQPASRVSRAIASLKSSRSTLAGTQARLHGHRSHQWRLAGEILANVRGDGSHCRLTGQERDEVIFRGVGRRLQCHYLVRLVASANSLEGPLRFLAL